MRASDNGLKTQIQFTDTDIALYTKRKGSEEPFGQEDKTGIRLPPLFCFVLCINLINYHLPGCGAHRAPQENVVAYKV